MSSFSERRFDRGEAGPFVATAHADKLGFLDSFRTFAKKPSVMLTTGVLIGVLGRGLAEGIVDDVQTAVETDRQNQETRQIMLDYGRCALLGGIERDACYETVDQRNIELYNQADTSWTDADRYRQEIEAIADIPAVMVPETNE